MKAKLQDEGIKGLREPQIAQILITKHRPLWDETSFTLESKIIALSHVKHIH